jgi:SAM-dependent methyltransferase
MLPGGIFHATFFELPDNVESFSEIQHLPGGIRTYGDADPYHYRFADLVYAAQCLPWRVEYVGEIGHPRGQRLVNFVRVEEKADELPSTRRHLPVETAHHLAPGDDHYRAYVGPPDRFDLMSATQFAMLFQMGMRDYHKVLDFGCGSLRLGRLLIPFLRAEHYFGIDPNKWLIDDGIANELGADAIRIKRPRFDYNARYDCEVFGTRFDFIMAQSIVTHTGPDWMTALFASVAKTLGSKGLFLFSYIRSDDGDAELPPDGWHYPGCVGYTEPTIERMLAAHGLQSVALPWFHPGAAWHAAALSREALPRQEDMVHLSGKIVR